MQSSCRRHGRFLLHCKQLTALREPIQDCIIRKLKLYNKKIPKTDTAWCELLLNRIPTPKDCTCKTLYPSTKRGSCSSGFRECKHCIDLYHTLNELCNKLCIRLHLKRSDLLDKLQVPLSYGGNYSTTTSTNGYLVKKIKYSWLPCSFQAV